MADGVDRSLGWLAKTLPGVVVGAAVALLFADDSVQKFWVALALLVVVLIAVQARRTRGAPIHHATVWLSLTLATVAIALAAFGPVAMRGYALVAAGMLAGLAVLAADRFRQATYTLIGVAGISVGVATIALGLEFLSRNEALYGVAGIAVGVSTIGIGLTFLFERESYGLAVIVGGAAGVLAGFAFLVDGDALSGSTVIGLGIAVVCHGVADLDGRTGGRGVTTIAVGVAMMGVGLAVLVDVDQLFGVAGIGGGMAMIARGVAILNGGAAVYGVSGIAYGLAGVVFGVAFLVADAPLVGVAVIAAGLGGVSGGVWTLRGSTAAQRFEAWWHRFTAVPGQPSTLGSAQSDPDASDTRPPDPLAT